LQYTFEQKTLNTYWFFREKPIIFGGFRGFMLFLFYGFDTMHLSLITYHDIFSKKPPKTGKTGFSWKNHSFLGFSFEGITTDVKTQKPVGLKNQWFFCASPDGCHRS
jgi:hypothetical protein